MSKLYEEFIVDENTTILKVEDKLFIYKDRILHKIISEVDESEFTEVS